MASPLVRWRLHSPASRLFTQASIHAKIKENIKALRLWPLWWLVNSPHKWPVALRVFFCRDSTADKSVPCFALNDLSINRIPNKATYNITVDMDMTQEPNMAMESAVSKPKDFISDLKNLRYCNPKNMIIGHINVNSIRNKFDPIHSTLQNGLCDIFALSETKLDESFPTAQFHITNFVLHRKDRNAHGGGVITYTVWFAS